MLVVAVSEHVSTSIACTLLSFLHAQWHGALHGVVSSHTSMVAKTCLCPLLQATVTGPAIGGAVTALHLAVAGVTAAAVHLLLADVATAGVISLTASCCMLL